MGRTLALRFNELDVEGYERVVEIINDEVGLRGIIAIHDTRLGPALGGIRAYPYPSFDDALNDVLRLAEGMTAKAAISQTGTGGGKSVIIIDHKKPKSKELLLAFAEAVNAFDGHYICAEDFGMLVSDLETIRQGTKFAVGLPHPKSSGDPSPFTSFGGFRGIQAVCQKLWGTDSPEGKTIAVQGLGSVGMKLSRLLFWAGARLIVTDVDKSRVDQAAKEFGAISVEPGEILSAECDILTPCALGGILNPDTISRLRCKAVAGLANNQLLSEEDGQALYERGILYAPDFLINSGGLLNVCGEIHAYEYNPFMARKDVSRIYDLLLQIFDMAEKQGISTHQVVNKIVQRNLEEGIGKRSEKVIFHH